MTPFASRRPGASTVAAGSLLLLLTGCSGVRQQRGDDSSPPPFVFRSLDLRQQDLLGRPTWRLSSPEARYDIRRRVAQAEKPQGVIFRDGKPAYRLSAVSGTVINDGQVVLLEGRIRVEQLGDRPMLIRAERARWSPSLSRLELDRRPEALDATSRLTARRARFQFDTNRLTLSERPRLQHWNRRFNPLADASRGRPDIVLRVKVADWYPRSGTLETSGPVLAHRFVPGRAPAQPPQTLTASRLEGNTVTQEFWLRAPVGFQDPVETSALQARDVRVDLREQRASSEGPFLGHRGALQVSGQGFVVYGGQQLITIPGACRLVQNGDSLAAQTCSWNWDNQDVNAQGGVELRRQANQQLSRGDSLSGRLGREGELTLTNPGGRVFSRFRVPHKPSRPGQPRPRPAAEPIRL